jgi:type I restriction enzyme R subunit
MNTSDISEKGLETLIVRHMTGTDGLAVRPGNIAEVPSPHYQTGYIAGSAKDYDRAHALDVPQLFAFLHATQGEAFKNLAMASAGDPRDINSLKFLTRLSSEIGKRGAIDVLRSRELHPNEKHRSRGKLTRIGCEFSRRASGQRSRFVATKLR